MFIPVFYMIYGFWSELPVCTVFTTVTIDNLHNYRVHKNMCFGCCIQRTSTALRYGVHSTAVTGVLCSLGPEEKCLVQPYIIYLLKPL